MVVSRDRQSTVADPVYRVRVSSCSRPGHRAHVGQCLSAHALCGSSIVHASAERLRERLRSRAADVATLAVGDELRWSAAVGAGDDRFARGKRLDRDESVVFLERSEAHDAATRQVIEQLRLGHPTGKRDAVLEAQLGDEPFQGRPLLAFTRDDRANAAAVRRSERAKRADRPVFNGVRRETMNT